MPPLSQSGGGSSYGILMNYSAFTNDSLAMMYEAVRGALAADDALERQGQETRFRVRERRNGRNTRLTWNPKCSSAA
jgi:hypothetical protein